MDLVKRCKIVCVSFITLVIFWVIDSAMDAFLFEEGTLAEQMFHPNSSEIYMRLSMSCSLVLLIYLRSTLCELREKEKKAKEAETRLSQLFRFSPAAISEIDREGTILFANDTYHAIHGYDAGELIGANIEVLIPEEEKMRTRALMDKILSQCPAPEVVHVQHVKKDGTRFDLDINWNYKYDENQEITGFVSVLTDITRRKESEEKTQKTLREKEVLLKEIHHRVKNNLQIIGSLLFLQASTIKDSDGDRAKFKEAQERVQTMAFVHELLYQSGDLDEIHFKSYVHHLVRSLVEAYNVDEKKLDIAISVKDFALGIDQAIPCGLIINELVTNVFKHAFPEGKKGNLQIDIYKMEEGMITMVVRDDGVGLPKDWNMNKGNTLGLRLVSLLVEQIEAELIIEKSIGTIFKIQFMENRI